MTTADLSTSGCFRGQVSGWKASRRGEQSAPMLTDVPLYVTGGLSVRTSPVAGRIFCVGGFDVKTDSIRSDSNGSTPSWEHSSLVEQADTPLRKRLRRHQSWYREEVLGLPPGTILRPDGSPRPVASRLPSWAVAEDPTLNFLANDEIYQVVLDRATRTGWGGIVEPDRLHHNLLSSQPLCFNLFAVLSEYGREELATALVKVFGLNIDSISDVRIEFRPPLDDGVKSGSAFDCFIEYETGHQRGFLGVETKYAEDLAAQKPSKNPSYAALTDAPGSGFKPHAGSRLNRPSTCQLWYNTVLAHRLRLGSKYSEGRIILLACEADTAAMSAAGAVRAEIEDPDDLLLAGTYEGLLSALPDSEDLAGWKEHFTQRYLDLGLSEIGG